MIRNDSTVLYRLCRRSAAVALSSWFLIAAPTPVTTIPLGPQPAFVSPSAAALVPSAGKLYVFNGPSAINGATPTPNIAIIDTVSKTLAGRLQPPVPANMVMVGVIAGRNGFFVNPNNQLVVAYTGGGSGMILVVDPTTDTVTQTLPIAQGIVNMAYNAATNKFYVGQYSATSPTQILVFDATTFAQLTTIPGVDNGVAGLLNGVFAPGAGGMPIVVNSATNTIYTAAAPTPAPSYGVLFIDGARDVAAGEIAIPAQVDDLIVDPVNNTVYARADVLPYNTVYAINGNANVLAATITTQNGLFGGPFSINPSINAIYSPLGTGLLISGASNTVQTGPVFGNFSAPVNSNCQSIPLTGQDFAISDWYGGCDGLILVADTFTGSYKFTMPVSYVLFWSLSVVDPASHMVYTISNPGNSVTAFDPIAQKATLIQLGNLPVSIGANATSNRIYVTDGPSSAAVVIDGSTNQILSKNFEVTKHPGAGPSMPIGMAVNSSTNKYIFLDVDTAVELDGATNAPSVFISPPFVNPHTGALIPHGFNSASVNQSTNAMYSSDTKSVYLTNLGTGAYATLATAACNIGALAVNEASNSIYVAEACQGGGQLEIFDGSAGALLQTFNLSAAMPAGSQPGSILFNAKTGKLYIANNGGVSGTTVVPPSTEIYNATTLAHLSSIPSVAGPLAVNTVLNAIYGAFTGAGGGVAVINGSTDNLSSTFGPGITVAGLAANEATNMIYVGDGVQGAVDVFLGDAPSPGAFSISGRVIAGNGAGIAVVTIASTGTVNATTVTDSNGLFTLLGIQAGSYTIAPTSAGFIYGPASQSVTVSTASVTGLSFMGLTTPIAVTSLKTDLAMIGPGVSTTATVTLNQPAPQGGITLTPSASNKFVNVSKSVTVAAGSSSATFNVQGAGAGTSTVMATYSGFFTPQASSVGTSITVAPTDTLHIQSATWSKSTQILSVKATSTNPQAILTVFLASNGQNLGAMTNNGGGSYSLQVSFTSGTPASINVKSNLGGSTGQGVTVTP